MDQSKKISLEEKSNVEESFSYKHLGIVIDQNGCINYKEQTYKKGMTTFEGKHTSKQKKFPSKTNSGKLTFDLTSRM